VVGVGVGVGMDVEVKVEVDVGNCEELETGRGASADGVLLVLVAG
jgi:hypothetical protein